MGNHYKAEQFINAIVNSAGIIGTIANRVGCDWHTAKKYIEQYPTVAQAYADECNKVLDDAESVVISAITPDDKDKDPDIQTAKWYLTMKGAHRGYASKQQLDIGGQVQLIGIDPDGNNKD